MPVYNWLKCIGKKKYEYVLTDINEYKEIILNECMAQFEKLYCEYLDTFGVNEDLQNLVLKQNEINSLKIDRVLIEDAFLDTIIALKQAELDALQNKEQIKKGNLKVAIEKYLGFRINEKEVTVKEYYEYINELSNGRATN